jgi:hypothetical protein
MGLDCKHNIIEYFNGADVGHKPVWVCDKCKKGLLSKENKWIGPKEVDQLRSSLKYMGELEKLQRRSRGRHSSSVQG